MGALSLLALKVAPNVFDLSSGQHLVSIRDQVVRAQILVRDLATLEPPGTRLLVIGAGFAGIAAAMAASARHWDVRVIDAHDAPLHLQSQVTSRFVGPFMYEWPAAFHDDQSFPPGPPAQWGVPSSGTPTWSRPDPMRASDLATDVQKWLLRQVMPASHPTLAFWMNVQAATNVAQMIKSFSQIVALRSAAAPGQPAAQLLAGQPPFHFGQALLWPQRTYLNNASFAPHYVILGAGLGQERVELDAESGAQPYAGTYFWANDRLRDPLVATQQVGVFGGGDGALQDVLRALTDFDHPLDMMRHLRRNLYVAQRIDAVEGRLHELEQQSRLLTTWDDTPNLRAMDQACSGLAAHLAGDILVRKSVYAVLRQGSGCVHHVVRENHFGKAYLLNRFLVHLIRECLPFAYGCMGYECYFDVDAIIVSGGSKLRRVRITPRSSAHSSAQSDIDLDEIVVRHGVDASKAPGFQLVQISPQTRATRTSMADIPLPFMLPDP